MERIRKDTISVVFVVSLFLLYTAGSLILAIIGTEVYADSADVSEKNYNMRTSLFYLTEKVRQSEGDTQIRTDSVFGGDALVIREEIGDYTFDTYIYIEDGYLCELSIIADTEVTEDIGQRIMELSALELSLSDDGVLFVEITDGSGNKFDTNLFLECYEEGV